MIDHIVLMLTHHSYTPEQMNAVTVAHRDARNWSDKVARLAVRVLRTGLDIASGYRHDKAVALNAKDPSAAARKYGMTEKKYLVRNIFLESVAGGMDKTSFTDCE
jgi:ubiquinol oxidase